MFLLSVETYEISFFVVIQTIKDNISGKVMLIIVFNVIFFILKDMVV